MDTKICTKCKTVKPIGEFNYSRPGAFRGDCKICQMAYNKRYLEKNPAKAKQYGLNRKPNSRKYRQVKKKERNEYLKEWGRKNPEKKRAQKYRYRYGIDIEDYNSLLDKQDGKCAICYSKNFGRAGAKHFVVDHCHRNGKVRGLLCHRCNMGIGFFNDSENTLLCAMNYLKRVSGGLT